VALAEDGGLPGRGVEAQDLAVEAPVVLGQVRLGGVARPDVERPVRALRIPDTSTVGDAPGASKRTTRLSSAAVK
jgi:hypothetical protein